MTLLDASLIALGVWFVLLIVTAFVNDARHRFEDQRRLALLIDQAGVVREVHRIKCVHDIDAVECLKDLLAGIDRFESGEVWRGRDRIGKIIAPRAVPISIEEGLAPRLENRPAELRQ